MTVVDLFCGIGWDVAARSLCLDPIGLDIDADVCATRALHSMPTIRADIATYPTSRFTSVDGLIASPPCQDFSRAGKRAGLNSERGQLVWQVERWAEALRPRWVACEQTEDVLPIWEMIAHRLRALGYRTWTGKLDAERYGVPQTRTRAILMAALDRQPHPPAPTHQKYVHGQPAVHTPSSMFHGEVLPWVSMAEALGWADDAMVRHQKGAGCAERHGESDPRPSTAPAPAPTITAGANRRLQVLRTGNNTMKHSRTGSKAGDGGVVAYERSVEEPAPTLDTQAGNKWTLHTNRGQDEHGNRQTRDTAAPAPALTAKAGGQWTLCDPRVFQPGGHHTPGAQSENAIRLQVHEGLVLQSFPPDFALAGSKTARWRQIGNAMPPMLARPIIEALAFEVAA